MLHSILDFIRSDTGRRVLASLLALVIALAVRALLVRVILRSHRMHTTDRLRWLRSARTWALILLVLSFVFIWGSELREFLVSLVVLASAFVLATKELFMCISGALLRATTRGFEVGDRIEVAGIRGDVIDIGLLGTTLLEISPGHQRTGRTQVIPNSLFLSSSIANETFTQEYVLHTFDTPVPRTMSWEAAERVLTDLANEVCAEHIDAARRSMDAASNRHGLTSFDVRPRTTVHPTGPSEVWLRLRVPTPARERGRIEQEILRRFLEQAPRRASLAGYEAPSMSDTDEL